MPSKILPDDVELDEEEVLPVDEEPTEDEAEDNDSEAPDEEEVTEEEPEEDESSDEQDSQASKLDVESLKAQVADELLAKLEPALGDMYNRLRQSSRDSARAEVGKQVKAQRILLDQAVSEGKLSKEDARGLLAEARERAEEEVEKVKNDDSPLPPLVKRESGGQADTRAIFQDACNAVLEARGVSLADPEAKELLTMRIPGHLSFSQALKVYSDAVVKVAKQKAISKGTGNTAAKKKPTLVDTGGKGKGPVTAESLTKELNALLKKRGGDFAVRRARDHRIQEISDALEKA